LIPEHQQRRKDEKGNISEKFDISEDHMSTDFHDMDKDAR